MSATEESKDTTGSTSSEEEPLLFSVADNETTPRTSSHASLLKGNAQFGESVSLKPPSSDTFTTQQPVSTAVDDLQQRQTRSIVTAILAVVLGVLNYAWQYTHPMTSLQILDGNADKLSTTRQSLEPTTSPLSWTFGRHGVKIANWRHRLC